MARSPEQIKAAIAALETQRAVLGDEVVETALAPLRAQLEELADEPRVRRRLVTVMFADLSGFTTLSERTDPEELAKMLSGLWASVDGIITEHRGHVLQHMGDGVLAVWSDQTALEDDPQQAVRAGLGIIEMVAREGLLLGGQRVDATASVGINTGPVHLRALDEFGYAALGDTTNVAARLEGKAGQGEIWISRATYLQVRGVFDVEDMGLLQLKGREDPVRAYRVERERDAAARLHERGLEGLTTNLVGRVDEQAELRRRFTRLVEASIPATIALIGDPGIGKSRLMGLVRSWAHADASVDVVVGRALPASSASPFSVLRSLLAARFDIRDTDRRDDVVAKLDAGFRAIEPQLGPAMARSIGWLAGFTPGESGLGRDDAQFRRNGALADLFDAIRISAGRRPLILVLEDLHWADDDSLALFASLAAASIPGLLLLASARPELLGEHPAWGDTASLAPGHLALRLQPLTPGDIDALLAQLLAPMAVIPEQIRGRVVAQCDGNPFHVEELVRMLIDERVIDTSGDAWSFDADRLERAKVPSTLAGVLQARLDRIEAEPFEVVQAGSVFGRWFWDHAVEAVVGREVDTASSFRTLETAALVVRQPTSRFDGADEEAFKHDFTRVVAYDTIDLERRPELHGRAAAWLERAAADRSDEFALSIAQHYDAAGNAVAAASWYTRAARRAQEQSAYAEAARLFELAAHHALPEGTERLQLTMERSYALVVVGRFDEATLLLEELLKTTEAAGQTKHWMLACAELGRIAMFRDGDFERARRLLDDGLRRGEAAGHLEDTILLRHQLGNLAIVTADWDEAIRLHSENVERADVGGERFRRGWALNSLAHCHAHVGHHEEALRLADEVVISAEQVGDPRLKMAGTAQKGLTYMIQAQWTEALHWFGEAQKLNRRNGDPEKLATVANYLGECAIGAGEIEEALRHGEEARSVAIRAGVRTELVRAVIILAEIAAHRGETTLATEALTAASSSSAVGAEARRMLEAMVQRTGLVPGEPPADPDAAVHAAAAALTAALAKSPTEPFEKEMEIPR